MSNDKLTPEEEAFFASNGEATMPDGYADDVKVPQNAPPAAEEVIEPAPGVPATDAETEAAHAGETEVEKPADVAAGDANEGKGPVNYGALKEERERRKKLEAKVEELAVREARTLERLNLILERQNAAAAPEPKKPEAPSIPDPEQDVLGATRYAIDRIKELDANTAQAEQDRHRQAEARRVQQQVIADYSKVVTERVQEDPTFEDAQRYLIQSRYNEMLADGVAPADAQRAVHSEEFNLAYDSLRRGVNPADRIAALAKARGWQPPTPKADPAPDAAEKLNEIARGQAAAASLSTAGASGTAKTGKVDAKALATMSDKEFKAFLEKNGEDGFLEAMSG